MAQRQEEPAEELPDTAGMRGAGGVMGWCLFLQSPVCIGLCQPCLPRLLCATMHALPLLDTCSSPTWSSRFLLLSERERVNIQSWLGREEATGLRTEP